MEVGYKKREQLIQKFTNARRRQRKSSVPDEGATDPETLKSVEMLPPEVQDILKENKMLQKEIKLLCKENDECTKCIEDLTHEVNYLKNSDAIDIKKQLCPDVFMPKTKCLPDSDIKLEISMRQQDILPY